MRHIAAPAGNIVRVSSVRRVRTRLLWPPVAVERHESSGKIAAWPTASSEDCFGFSLCCR